MHMLVQSVAVFVFTKTELKSVLKINLTVLPTRSHPRSSYTHILSCALHGLSRWARYPVASPAVTQSLRWCTMGPLASRADAQMLARAGDQNGPVLRNKTFILRDLFVSHDLDFFVYYWDLAEVWRQRSPDQSLVLLMHRWCLVKELSFAAVLLFN